MADWPGHVAIVRGDLWTSQCMKAKVVHDLSQTLCGSWKGAQPHEARLCCNAKNVCVTYAQGALLGKHGPIIVKNVCAYVQGAALGKTMGPAKGPADKCVP